MNKNIKLIVADIDATLKETKTIGLPELNLKALEDLHKQGYLTGIASGRSVDQIDVCVKKWGMSYKPDLFIGVNGSSMYDKELNKEEILLTLKKETIKEVIDILIQNNIPFFEYIDNYTIFSSESSRYFDLIKDMSRDIRVGKTINDYLNGNIFKVLFNGQDIEDLSIVKEILKPFVDKHSDEVKLVMTTKECLELVHKDTSKALALIKYCQRHNINLNEVASFGDSENDEEMLEASGMSVCLKDGMERTKKKSKYITELDCKDGGFGDFVYKNILN